MTEFIGRSKPSSSFWLVSGIALLWNLMGVGMYLMMTQMTPEVAMEGYGQEFADIFANKPAWATGAFAIAVFAGLMGSIGLLLRKTWATILFVISLIGVIIHDIWGVMAGTLSVVGTFDKVMTVVVILVSFFLIWFARKKTAEGVLT